MLAKSLNFTNLIDCFKSNHDEDNNEFCLSIWEIFLINNNFVKKMSEKGGYNLLLEPIFIYFIKFSFM